MATAYLYIVVYINVITLWIYYYIHISCGAKSWGEMLKLGNTSV